MALVANAALASCSLATQGQVNVARDQNLTGPISLNLMVIAESGERKTRADERMTRAVRQWEENQREALKDSVRESQARHKNGDRRKECEQALLQLQERGLPIAALRDVTAEDLRLVDSTLASHLARRARHVVEECARVKRGAALLRAGRVDELGDLMAASHRSSRDLYEVSLPELDVLAEAAWSAEGCVGARLSGAGFGGCVVALCEAEAVSEVGKRLEIAYSERFGRSPDMFHCRLAEGAGVLA